MTEGVFHYKNALDGGIVERINDALDVWMIRHIAALSANKRTDGTYPRLIGLHEEVPELETLFSSAPALMLRDLFVGHRRTLQTSITFLQGSQQPLHRDVPVFRVTSGGFYMRIWIALEDTTPENGTLTGVRGGHRVATEKYKVPHSFYTHFEQILAEEPQRWEQHQQTLKQAYADAGLREERFALSAGDMLIWHPLFPHGGSAIIDKRASRRAVVLHISEA